MNIGDVVIFHTRSNDMMNFDGAKCRIIGKTFDGRYKVEFIDYVVTVFPEELTKE